MLLMQLLTAQPLWPSRLGVALLEETKSLAVSNSEALATLMVRPLGGTKV